MTTAGSVTTPSIVGEGQALLDLTAMAVGQGSLIRDMPVVKEHASIRTTSWQREREQRVTFFRHSDLFLCLSV